MANIWTRSSADLADAGALFQAGADKKRILFVDDEPTVLQLFQIMFEPMKQEWEVVTCGSGKEALALFAKQPFEVVVSDQRMPGMSGIELLARVMKTHPQTARFIISGYSDQEQVANSMGTVLQFLQKPCDLLTLKTTLTRVCGLDVFLHNEGLKTLAAQMGTLPSVPAIYFQLLKELRLPDASTEKIGDLVTQDPSLSAKLLQLVNSAFFGIARKIANPTEAVQLLGVNAIRSLALCAHAFSCFEESKAQVIPIQRLWNHSMATGRIAKKIAQMARAESTVIEEAFIAGLLHDLGVLMFSVNLPKRYQEALALAQWDQVELWQAEEKIFGATHADMGAYLLGLWGLPVAIVEGVALHHHVFKAAHRNFSPLTAAHVANVFEHQQSEKTNSGQGCAKLDMVYLGEVGIADYIADWQSEIAEMELSAAA